MENSIDSLDDAAISGSEDRSAGSRLRIIPGGVGAAARAAAATEAALQARLALIEVRRGQRAARRAVGPPAGEGGVSAARRRAALNGDSPGARRVKAIVEGMNKGIGNGDGWFRPGHDIVYDQDHAQAVLEWAVNEVRYVSETGVWLFRDRKAGVWKDGVGSDAGLARQLLAHAANKVPRVGSNPGEKKPWKDLTPDELCWKARSKYRSSGGAAAVAGFMVPLAAREGSAWSVSEAELDGDPWVLWTPAGAVWLGAEDDPRKGLLCAEGMPHRKITRVAPDASVDVSGWNRFLRAVWPDAAVREWACNLLAVGLTGSAEKMFIYLHGHGDAGKTSVVKWIADLLGGYAAGDLESGLVSEEAKPWDTIKLQGARLGFIDEAMPPGRGPTETLKRMTGGATLSGAQKNKRPVSWRPTHTLVFTANPVPVLTDPAVAARIRLVPCFGDVEAVRAAWGALGGNGGAGWEREAPGVLADLIERARAYVADPRIVSAEAAPMSLQTELGELVGEQDHLLEWLGGCTVADETLGTGSSLSTTALYDEFARWCGLNRRTERYLGSDKTVSWLGIRLTEIYGKDKPMRRRLSRGVVWQLRLTQQVRDGRLFGVV